MINTVSNILGISFGTCQCIVTEDLNVGRLAMISGFRCNADEICTLLGYYAASNGNPLPTFRSNVLVPSSSVLDFLTLEDGPHTLSRNIGKGLPFSTA
jgi:hypothetical protein